MRRLLSRTSRFVHEIPSSPVDARSPDGQGQPRKPAFQKQLEGKDLVFQLHTLDSKVARHYIVKDLKVSARRGTHPSPAFALGFKDGAYGFATMTSKNPQLAFMQGIQNKDIQIQGNPAW